MLTTATQNGGDEMARELQGRIDDVTSQIEQMQPNMKAIDRFVPRTCPAPGLH